MKEHISELCTYNIADVTVNEHTFGIRAADIEERRNSASLLINKMYSWRGYSGNHRVGNEPHKITLTATNKEGETIGTLSLGMDTPDGLLADQVFRDCIEPYRQKGKVCEITKLAIDPTIKSKEILASLFHVAFLYARDIHQCKEIFIEVNPRHRRFYEAMLSFKVECESRDNPRVDAPAVLLRMNTEEGTNLIKTCKESSLKEGLKDRSLLYYFFSKNEENGILKRLQGME